MGYPAVHLNEEQLYQLYVVEQKSVHETARLLGCSAPTVHRRLRQAGLIRSVSEARKVARTPTYSAEGLAAKQASISRNREKITAESREKHRQKMLGRVPPNKGVPWTPEHRAKQIELRSTDEYRAKLAASHKGSKSHLWRGGITPDNSLHGWEWRKRRREVYERDGWICQDCKQRCLNTADSKKYPKRKIQAHHIISRRNGGTDELSNLVTLCMSCHHKRERRYKEALFA